jgi:hypothetical protein
MLTESYSNFGLTAADGDASKHADHLFVRVKDGMPLGRPSRP